MDEAALVQEAKMGNEQSFEQLVDPHRKNLEAFLARRIPRTLRRKVAPEDVLQDAVITAYARLGSFDMRGEGSFRAWLWRIAELKLNEAIRRFAGTAKRGAAGEISRGGRPDTEQFRGAPTTPSQHAMAAELQERVRGAMDRLSEDYRQILQLIRAQELSLRDAADEIGRSYEATKKLYARAMKALQRELGEDAADPEAS